jgi:hypothetical protein
MSYACHINADWNDGPSSLLSDSRNVYLIHDQVLLMGHADGSQPLRAPSEWTLLRVQSKSWSNVTNLDELEGNSAYPG